MGYNLPSQSQCRTGAKLVATATRNEPIQFRNQPFFIHKFIENCPSMTVIRELLKNAEDAALGVSPAGTVKWFTESVGDVPKLGLFNEGPGMSGEDLSRLMDLASTGKQLGIDQNFGQGAKVSGLKVSPFGMVYRSCHLGRVSQITLAAEHQAGFDHPVYVKRRTYIDGTWEEVIDVTDDFSGRRDRPLDVDWTEVVILGKSADHDTVHKLIPGMASTNWLMQLINTRFYRFGPGITVRGAFATTGSREPRAASGLEDLTMSFAKSGKGGARMEDVPAVHPAFGPITIRYCKLQGEYNRDKLGHSRARTMDAYGVGSRGDHICLVWRNECYDIHTSWVRIAGPFGLTFGSANVVVQILLPDDCPIKNNDYRDQVIDRDGDNQPVRVEVFAELVRISRPEWLVEYVEQQALSQTNNKGVMERLKAFLEELKAAADERSSVDPANNGHEGSEQKRRYGTPNPNPKPREDSATPTPQRPPASGKKLPSRSIGIPVVDFTDDPAILEEMNGKAAVYRKEENTVLLNPAYFRYVEGLESCYQDVGADADVRALAKRHFDEEYCVRAGQFVIQAWLNRGRPEFTDKDFDDALSIGSLTTNLTSPESMEKARHKIRQKLQSTKMENIL
jgi:hypothetical protein